jgi:glycosyltransferase involved in cell wall biosynthesis
MNDVDIVIPVHNEEHVLAASLHLLDGFLRRRVPYSARIVVADNASTDATLAVAHATARELRSVRVLHLDEKGRGRALRRAWGESDAEVVAYMDVDLSTDLKALEPLVAPLLGNDADVAIGSRLAPRSRVTRGVKRELISRAYNGLLHLGLGLQASDAQCGFKAGRRTAIQALLPEIEDGGWFFDTELLYLAERNGLRIHEVPVEWVEDPDSRVNVLTTAIEDLRGIARLRRTEAPAAGFGAPAAGRRPEMPL